MLKNLKFNNALFMRIIRKKYIIRKANEKAVKEENE